MDRNHDAMLQRHVEEAFHRGWTVVPWWSLYLWFDMDRLSKSAWRDILERWRELSEKDGSKFRLMVLRGADDGVLLVGVDGEKVPREKRNFVSIEELADDLLAKL